MLIQGGGRGCHLEVQGLALSGAALLRCCEGDRFEPVDGGLGSCGLLLLHSMDGAVAPGVRRSELAPVCRAHKCALVCMEWPRALQTQALQQAGRRRGVALRVVEPPDVVRALLKVLI
jgi:hypothetical protein